MLIKTDINMVIYHGGCTDGFASAFIVWHYYKTKNLNNSIEYIALYHNNKQIPANINKQSNILICDISFDYAQTLEIIEKANSVMILDHHISNKKDLELIDNEYKIFDMMMSGAGLTWRYLFEDEPMPLLIKYIQARDLWDKSFELVDEFNQMFNLVEMKFETYAKYLDDALLLNDIKTKGCAFIELSNYYVEYLANKACPIFCLINGKYYFNGVVNSPIIASDIGNRIFSYYQLLSFSTVYSIDNYNNSIRYSLRSTPNRADVSHIAKYFGGGGHVCASGYRTDEINFADIVYDRGVSYKLLSNIELRMCDNLHVGLLLMNADYQLEHLTKFLATDNNFVKIWNLLNVDNKIDTIDVVVGYIIYPNNNTIEKNQIDINNPNKIIINNII